MRFVKLIKDENKKNEVYGLRLLFKFDNKIYKTEYKSFNQLSATTQKEIKIQLYKKMIEYKKELQQEKIDKILKNDLKKFLRLYSNNKEYLTIAEIKKLLDENIISLNYMFDLFSVVEIFRTKKGIKVIDTFNNSTYLYKNDYVFYIEGLSIN